MKKIILLILIIFSSCSSTEILDCECDYVQEIETIYDYPTGLITWKYFLVNDCGEENTIIVDREIISKKILVGDCFKTL